MADIAWIKLKTDMFDHEKVKVIESMPEADTILIVWVKILVLAAKANASGFLMIAENVPYTEDMLAAVVGRPLNVVRMALHTFRSLAMIDPETDVIRIKNWDVHQNVDGMDRIREQNRLRVEKYREKQRLIGCNVTGNVTDTESNALDIEEDKEKELKTKQKATSQDADLASHIFALILRLNPNHKRPDLLKWADTVRLMRERDGRTHAEIRDLFEWANADNFWKTNILSPTTLRDKWDRLTIQRQHRGARNETSEPVDNSAIGKVRRANAARAAAREQIDGDALRAD